MQQPNKCNRQTNATNSDVSFSCQSKLNDSSAEMFCKLHWWIIHVLSLVLSTCWPPPGWTDCSANPLFLIRGRACSSSRRHPLSQRERTARWKVSSFFWDVGRPTSSVRYRGALDRIGEVVKGLQPREKGKVPPHIPFQSWLSESHQLLQILEAMRKAGFSCEDVKDLG